MGGGAGVIEIFLQRIQALKKERKNFRVGGMGVMEGGVE